MRKVLQFLLLTFAFSSFIIAQTVQDVPATESNGDPIINSLIKYVVADTNASGQQMHDIYKLERGKTYFYNQGAVFNNPITLVADEPGTDDATKPPKFLVTTDDQGEVPEEPVIYAYADVTCKNIAFSTITVDGEYSWANAIVLQQDNLRIRCEGCYFELIGWGMIEADGIEHTNLFFDKCEVRNGSPFGGDEWVPFFFEGSAGSADTCIVRNCTFFGVQGSVLNIESQAIWKYILFDHNTMVNIVQNFTTDIAAHINSTFTNNIFYNVGCYGSRLADIMSGGGDHVQGGIIIVDTLVSNTPSGSGLPHVIDEKDRILVAKNNVYFWSQGVHDYWTANADSIVSIPWMSSRAQHMFDDDTNYPNFVRENNVEADPGFANFGGTDDMVAQMYNDRINGTFGFWGWDPDSALYPDVHWAFLQWPLPEDFSYSNTFTSTDGFHVGSLQWYPTEMVDYYNITAVDDKNFDNPKDFSLTQNYPNPFNPNTTVKFTLSETGATNLSVYNAIGQKVKSVVDNQVMSSGTHQVNIDLSDQSSGIYLLVLKQQSNMQVIKMTLLK